MGFCFTNPQLDVILLASALRVFSLTAANSRLALFIPEDVFMIPTKAQHIMSPRVLVQNKDPAPRII